MPYEIIKIKRVESPGIGALQFFEGERDILFPIKRIYYITDVPQDTERGGHAHKDLKQLLFCPYGSVLIRLDDGKEKKEVLLDRPDIGIVLTPCIWREMRWNVKDSVLCVAASEYYIPDDYIRDYDEFTDYIKNNGITGGNI